MDWETKYFVAVSAVDGVYQHYSRYIADECQVQEKDEGEGSGVRLGQLKVAAATKAVLLL